MTGERRTLLFSDPTDLREVAGRKTFRQTPEHELQLPRSYSEAPIAVDRLNNDDHVADPLNNVPDHANTSDGIVTQWLLVSVELKMESLPSERSVRSVLTEIISRANAAARSDGTQWWRPPFRHTRSNILTVLDACGLRSSRLHLTLHPMCSSTNHDRKGPAEFYAGRHGVAQSYSFRGSGSARCRAVFRLPRQLIGRLKQKEERKMPSENFVEEEKLSDTIPLLMHGIEFVVNRVARGQNLMEFEILYLLLVI